MNAFYKVSKSLHDNRKVYFFYLKIMQGSFLAEKKRKIQERLK